jgi:hypothetical protein
VPICELNFIIDMYKKTNIIFTEFSILWFHLSTAGLTRYFP